MQAEFHAAALRADFVRSDKRIRMRARTGADKSDRWCQACGKRTTKGIVEIDDRRRQPGRCKQSRLGGPIRRHVAVIVQMIATELGEYRQSKADGKSRRAACKDTG